MAATEQAQDRQSLHCSFCAKSQHEVRKLVSARQANICDECVDACFELLTGKFAAPIGSLIRHADRLGIRLPAAEMAKEVLGDENQVWSDKSLHEFLEKLAESVAKRIGTFKSTEALESELHRLEQAEANILRTIERHTADARRSVEQRWSGELVAVRNEISKLKHKRIGTDDIN